MKSTMRRCRATSRLLSPACGCALIVLSGCAASQPALAPGARTDDPSFGLPPGRGHRSAEPLDRSPVWRTWAKGDHARWPVEFAPETPLEAVTERHPAWAEDDPIEIKPNRPIFFLSGFLAGAALRVAIAAASGSAGQGVTGDDFASAVMVGTVTGVAAWSYSFRLPPASLDKRLQLRKLPEIKDTRTWQTWGPDRE